MQKIITTAEAEQITPIGIGVKRDERQQIWAAHRGENSFNSVNLSSGPRIQENVDCDGEAARIITLIPSSSFKKVKIEKMRFNEIVLTSRKRLKTFLLAPSAPENTPGTYLGARYAIFCPVKWRTVIVYSDNTVIELCSPCDHTSVVKEAKKLFKDAGVPNS